MLTGVVIYRVIIGALVASTAMTGWTAYYFEVDAARRHRQKSAVMETQLTKQITALQRRSDTVRQACDARQKAASEPDAADSRTETQLVTRLAERDDLNSRVDTARTDQTRIAEELQAMLSERDRLAAQLDSAKGAQAELRTALKANKARINAAVAELEGSQRQRATLQERQQRLRTRLDAAIEKQSKLRARLQATKKRIDAKQLELRAAKEKLDKLQSNLSDATGRIARLTTAVDRAEQARQQEIERFEQLKIALENKLRSQEITIERLRNDRTLIRVGGDILFSLGSAELKPNGAEALRLIAEALKEFPGRQVSLEGHTDNLTIGGALSEIYPSNWELSAARGARAARFLQTEAGIDPRRLRVVGYSEYRPVAPNDEPGRRARNRRIEIMLLPRAKNVSVKQAELPHTP
ncbi:MAG: OmpA family protein [Gammaproteobacteria bacterium]|nr:OmpA family protein [Gammaproteobacteria bacterium]